MCQRCLGNKNLNYSTGWMCSVRDMGAENGLAEMSSNSGLVCCVYFLANALRKDTNTFLPSARGEITG